MPTTPQTYCTLDIFIFLCTRNKIYMYTLPLLSHIHCILNIHPYALPPIYIYIYIFTFPFPFSSPLSPFFPDSLTAWQPSLDSFSSALSLSLSKLTVYWAWRDYIRKRWLHPSAVNVFSRKRRDEYLQFSFSPVFVSCCPRSFRLR